jgi:hypothetical protein
MARDVRHAGFCLVTRRAGIRSIGLFTRSAKLWKSGSGFGVSGVCAEASRFGAIRQTGDAFDKSARDLDCAACALGLSAETCEPGPVS